MDTLIKDKIAAFHVLQKNYEVFDPMESHNYSTFSDN